MGSKGSSSSGYSQTAPSSGGISPYEFASRFGAVAPSAGTSSAPAQAAAPTREVSRGDGAAPSAQGRAPTSEDGSNAVGYGMVSAAKAMGHTAIGNPIGVGYAVSDLADAARASRAIDRDVNQIGHTTSTAPMTDRQRTSLLDENYGDEDNDGEFGGGMDGDLGGM